MNKRHYEHTLPNIRGSLSNTYPVISLKVHADIDSIVKVGSQIEQTIFKNSDRTIYEIVP